MIFTQEHTQRTVWLMWLCRPIDSFVMHRGYTLSLQKANGFLSMPLLCMVSRRNAAVQHRRGSRDSTQEISLEPWSSKRQDSAIHSCTLFKLDNILCWSFQTTLTSEFNEHVWTQHSRSVCLSVHLWQSIKWNLQIQTLLRSTEVLCITFILYITILPILNVAVYLISFLCFEFIILYCTAVLHYKDILILPTVSLFTQ